MHGGMRFTEQHRLLDLPLKIGVLDYGGNHLLNVFGTEPAFIYMADATRIWTTRAYAEYRDYQDDDGRDAPFLRLGEKVRLQTPDARRGIDLSLYGFYEFSDEDRFANYGLEALVEADVKVTRQIELYGALQYRGADYKDEIYPDLQDADRSDRQYQLLAGARWRFIEPAGLHVNYRYVRNDSNFDLFEYQRNVVSFNAFWEY